MHAGLINKNQRLVKVLEEVMEVRIQVKRVREICLQKPYSMYRLNRGVK